MNEASLIQHCLEGDLKSQKQLYDLYSGQMYSICLRYCREAWLAQEALQNGFIQVYRHLATFRQEGPLGAWIRKIIVRNCLRVLQREHQHALQFTQNDAHLEWAGVEQPQENMTYEHMLKYLDLLPEGYRMVFSMYVLDDLSHAEIAAVLDITESTSRSQLKKARHYLMGLFNNEKLITHE